MADFIEVMNSWREMCNKQFNCHGCPMDEIDVDCPVVDNNSVDFKEVETVLRGENATEPTQLWSGNGSYELTDEVRLFIHEVVDNVMRHKGASVSIGLYESGPYISIMNMTDDTDSKDVQDASDRKETKDCEEVRED